MDEQLLALIIPFSLIMTRIIGFFLVVPFFGSVQIPARVKAGLAVFCTLIIFPFVSSDHLHVELQPLLFVQWLVNETLAGFLLGFVVFIIFSTIQLAGQFIDLRMGFALVNVIDPQSGEQIPLAGQLKTVLATLFFLSLYGHHLLLQGIIRSFEVLSLGETFPILISGEFIIRVIGDLFIIAFKVALPIIGALFITDLVFGFLARTIPQINMFSVGLPTKILLGTFVIFLSLPTFGEFFRQIFTEMFQNLDTLLQGIGG